ncbi:anaphase-promoting complex subunitm [Pycnococcus provasolii]
MANSRQHNNTLRTTPPTTGRYSPLIVEQLGDRRRTTLPKSSPRVGATERAPSPFWATRNVSPSPSKSTNSPTKERHVSFGPEQRWEPMLAKEESFENRRRAQKLAAERLATTDTAATKARKQASASSTLDAAATTTTAATAMLLPTSNSVPSIRSVSPIRQRVKNAAAVSPWSRQSLREVAEANASVRARSPARQRPGTGSSPNAAASTNRRSPQRGSATGTSPVRGRPRTSASQQLAYALAPDDLLPAQNSAPTLSYTSSPSSRRARSPVRRTAQNSPGQKGWSPAKTAIPSFKQHTSLQDSAQLYSAAAIAGSSRKQYTMAAEAPAKLSTNENIPARRARSTSKPSSPSVYVPTLIARERETWMKHVTLFDAMRARPLASLGALSATVLVAAAAGWLAATSSSPPPPPRTDRWQLFYQPPASTASRRGVDILADAVLYLFLAIATIVLAEFSMRRLSEPARRVHE